MTAVVAVALHDVEPRSFARCREIRNWLEARQVMRATLLVIPAADLHPIGVRAPELASWLRRRVAAGDVVAQHGLVHRANGTLPWPRSALVAWQGGAAAEFPGLPRDDAARRVAVGRQLLREIGLEPRGFVAPAYAYTRALRALLAESYEWFADLRVVRCRHADVHAPVLCLGSSTMLKRTLSPPLIRTAARAIGTVMRVDIHPADFDQPTHIATLECVLNQARAQGRIAVTYDDFSFKHAGGVGASGQDEGQGAGAGVRSMPIA